MKLLIAFDGSHHSESAVSDLQLAGLPADAEAVVLSVLDCRSSERRTISELKEPDGTANLDFNKARDQQFAVAQRGANLVSDLFPTWKVAAEVSFGSPAWKIIQRAEGGSVHPQPFDLVVLGSRGHGELKRLLLGSVAHRVITTLRGSVRVSRGKSDRMTAPSGGVVAPPRVVVGVDGSTDAQSAVEAIAQRDWPYGTRVIMASFETGPLATFSNWEPNTIWGGAPILPDSATAAGRPALRVVTEAEEFVRFRRPDLVINTLVKAADPKYGLLGASEETSKHGADCIFVGASGVRGLERFLLGSVSTTVAMNAACSVEIVRHREERNGSR
ncbi:MAG: universal stress protein [Phycisphaerae bacterium]|nr:universal stress protein [Phycisphaerae bacterium]